ncbi:MAG: tetratricopeptide repeat protein, partial [Vicinamibacterales bacterium]
VQPGQPSIPQQLDAYAGWLSGHGQPLSPAAPDLDAARAELGRIAPAFLRAGGSPAPDVYEHRRRILVAFALELAASGAHKQAGAAAQLVEWACGYVRSHSPLNDFDRAWQRAALAVLEGGIDSRALQAHLTHADAFMPEPRLLLARGIAEEQTTAPSETIHAGQGIDPSVAAVLAGADAERARAAERAVARFRDAERDPAVRAEAALRMGHVLLELKRDEEALTAWTVVDQSDPDLAVKYLVQVFRGLAYEGLGRNTDAASAYAAALAISPGAHSATMRLAALDFRLGRADEANRLLTALLQNDDPRRDPWWAYYAGDWRFWYARISLVRALTAVDVK